MSSSYLPWREFRNLNYRFTKLKIQHICRAYPGMKNIDNFICWKLSIPCTHLI